MSLRTTLGILVSLASLAGCDQPKTQDLDLLCRAQPFDQGGPKDPNDVIGMSIRNGEITFTGSTRFNLPASQWKAKMCPKSKYSNEKLVHFDNLNCTEVELGKLPSEKNYIVGQYDYLTKEMAILATGNFVCSETK
jgi:hypothetical protein